MICGRCGKTLDAGDRFCRYCGSSDVREETPQKPDDLEIKGDTLVKCNAFKGRLEERCPFDVYSTSYNRSFFGKDKVNPIEVIEGFQKGLIPRDSFYYDRTEKFVEAYKKRVITIPSNVKTVDRGDGYKTTFEGCVLFTIKYPSDIEFTRYSLTEARVLYFTLPKKTKYLYKPYFGELKLNPTPNSDGVIELYGAHINRLVVPSYIRRVSGANNHGEENPYELSLTGCTIDEAILEGCPEIYVNERNMTNRVHIGVLRYNGSKSQYLRNNSYYFADTVICRDGTLYWNKNNVGTVFTDSPKDAKMIDLKFVTKNINGFNMTKLLVQYNGTYFGYMKTGDVLSKEFTVSIPDAIRSIEVTYLGYNSKRATIYRSSSYGPLVVDFDTYFK